MVPNLIWTRRVRTAAELRPLAAGTRIRRFEPDDATDVHALLQEAGEVGPWLRELLEHQDHDTQLQLVADTDAGELVGLAFARRTGEVSHVAVADAWRRRGAGAALLGRVLELLRRRQCFLATSRIPTDPIARAFARSMGFQPAPGDSPNPSLGG